MSDSTTKVRGGKLTFKGDKKNKKRKRKEKDVGGEEGGSAGEASDGEGGDPQAWVYPSNPLHVLGPTFILHPTSPNSPTCITYESTRARIALHSLSADEEGIAGLVPTEVNQVWVVTRIAGSPTINLRTPDGKFMSCDQHGVVSSDREARGPQEEWTPIVLPDAPGMVAFQNNYAKYLSVDETAGGTMSLRADSEEVGFNERFFVKVQREYKKKAGEEERKRTKGESMAKIDEAGTNKKFQAWGAGRSVVSDADRKELKKARKEGNLSEAMLDRRAKLKSDRFC